MNVRTLLSTSAPALKWRPIVSVASLAWLLSGCASLLQTSAIADDIDPAKVRQIVRGQTTVREAIAWFGGAARGDSTMPTWDGTYTFTAPTKDGATNKLVVIISHGLVQDYTFTEGLTAEATANAAPAPPPPEPHQP